MRNKTVDAVVKARIFANATLRKVVAGLFDDDIRALSYFNETLSNDDIRHLPMIEVDDGLVRLTLKRTNTKTNTALPTMLFEIGREFDQAEPAIEHYSFS